MAKDGSSSISSSSSSSGSDSGSGSSSFSSSSSSSSSQGGSPPRKPAAGPAKSRERDAREVLRRARSPSRSPRALKRKRDSPVRHSRSHRDDSSPRRRHSSPPRGRNGRSPADRRRKDSPDEKRSRYRDEDIRRSRHDGDGRGARDERHNGRRELPPPPPRLGERDSDRHGGRGRERRSGFGEEPGEAPPAELPGPPANGGAPPIEGKIHRSRANRWDLQENQAVPGPPGPPGPPPRREDRDWNHQSREEALPQEEKPPPEANFALSGKLAEESNTVNGVVLLHTEPPEARKPHVRWRLYTFKNGELFGTPLPIYRQSCYIFGRERRIADIPTDHPSCSKQHAILQYRLTDKEERGLTRSEVRPYIMDLGSTNGTFLNNERLDSERYYELLPKDLLKFGNSSREYVLLHENAAEEG